MNEREVNENEGIVNDKNVAVNERKDHVKDSERGTRERGTVNESPGNENEDHVNDSERESGERGIVNESSVNESKDQVISRSWIILVPAT